MTCSRSQSFKVVAPEPEARSAQLSGQVLFPPVLIKAFPRPCVSVVLPHSHASPPPAGSAPHCHSAGHSAPGGEGEGTSCDLPQPVFASMSSHGQHTPVATSTVCDLRVRPSFGPGSQLWESFSQGRRPGQVQRAELVCLCPITFHVPFLEKIVP